MSHWRKSSGITAGQPGLSGPWPAGEKLKTAPDIADERPAGTLDSGDPAVHCALKMPELYEPGYAYPLIVWLHDEGADESELLRALPWVSDRNYAGLAVRGPLPVLNGLPHRRRWSVADRYLTMLEDELSVALEQALEHVNIHRERIVVAGMGQGATLSLRLMLRRPEWFAAAVCVGGEWAATNRFEAWGRYAHKPLWLGQIEGWTDASSQSAIGRARLLRAVGFDVTTHVVDFDDADPANLGHAIDRWLMQTLCPDSVVM